MSLGTGGLNRRQNLVHRAYQLVFKGHLKGNIFSSYSNNDVTHIAARFPVVDVNGDKVNTNRLCYGMYYWQLASCTCGMSCITTTGLTGIYTTAKALWALDTYM